MNENQITLQSFLTVVENPSVAWAEADLEAALRLAETLPDHEQEASDAVWKWCEGHPEIGEAVERQVMAMEAQDRLPGDGQAPELTTPAFRTALRNSVLRRRQPADSTPERGATDKNEAASES